MRVEGLRPPPGADDIDGESASRVEYRDVMQEHLAILDALAAGNGQAAREAMEQHIDQVRATIISRLTDSHRRR